MESVDNSIITIAGSELLQSGTYFAKKHKRLSEIIGESILKDGKDGVYDGSATVIYKDAKRFGGMVKIDGTIFRVTGVTRKKESRPIADYDLREVKQ